MLTSTIKYSPVSAKVRALKGRLLTEEDYKNLASLKTVKDAALALKANPSYAYQLSFLDENDIHRGQIERRLSAALYEEFVRFYKFITGSDRRFLDVYIIKYDITIIKMALKVLFNQGDIHYNYQVRDLYVRHTKIDIVNLIKAKNITEFINMLKGTQYYNILSFALTNKYNIFDLEMRLDQYYISSVWNMIEKSLSGKNKELLLHSMGTEIDLTNIVWIYRAKTYYSIDNNLLYAYLIPYRYKLKKENITEMVEAKDTASFMEKLNKTPYAGFCENLPPNGIEQRFRETMLKINMYNLVHEPFSIASVTSYLHIKEIEIHNIVSVIEGIRYGLDSEEILRRIALLRKSRGEQIVNS